MLKQVDQESKSVSIRDLECALQAEETEHAQVSRKAWQAWHRAMMSGSLVPSDWGDQ